MLQDLTCRFAVVELEYKNEERLFDFLTLGMKVLLYQIDDKGLPPQPTGRSDAIAVSKAYATRLSTSLPPLNMALLLFEWAVSSLDFDRPESMISFFEASYLRLWTALDMAKESPPLTYKQINDVAEYADRIFGYTV
jgi:hypothetical protein